MAALLALLSSLTWGTGDFFGGLLARRRSAIPAVLAMQAFGLLSIAIWASVTGTWAVGSFLLAGLGAGVSGSLGLMAFYRALATGTMGVVAPIAAMGVAVPLLYGLVRGDQPSTVQWLGILLAVVGFVLASGPELAGAASPEPLLYASGAAVMFGIALAFMAAGAGGSATMTVLTMRVVQVAIAIGFWVRWRGFGGITRRDLPLAAVTGVCDVGANLMYAFAAALGPITIVAVLGSFPPVATAVLGRVVLQERLLPMQVVGVLLALGGAVAISAG